MKTLSTALLLAACCTALSPAALPSKAWADARDDALSAMLRCSGMGDKAQRLVCYDSAVVRVPGALNQPAQPQAMASAVPGAVPPPAPYVAPRKSPGFLDGMLELGQGIPRQPQTTVAQFGSESIPSHGRDAHPSSMYGDTLDQISARVVRFGMENGLLQVTLDNGQIWQQMVGPSAPMPSRQPLLYVAIISRGTGGYYTLKLSHYGKQLPVHRIQ